MTIIDRNTRNNYRRNFLLQHGLITNESFVRELDNKTTDKINIWLEAYQYLRSIS